MANTKKYVSLAKLTTYDELLKAKMAADDAAALKSAKDYADSLASNYEVAGAANTALTNAKAYTDQLANGQVATNKADIAKLNGDATTEGSVAKAVADSAATLQASIDAVDAIADQNAADIDALEGKVAALEAGTYDDTEVRGLISDNADAIDALEQTHATDKGTLEAAIALKAAQTDLDAVSAVANAAATQTALQAEIDRAKGEESRIEGLVTAEAERAAGVEEDLTDRIETMEAFWAAAQADGTDSNVIDTLKEIQDYIASDETGAADMLAAIEANEKAISDMDAAYKAADSTLQGNIDALSAVVDTKAAASDLTALTTRVTTAEGAIDTVEGRMDTAEADIDALQALFGEGEGSVSDQIADAVAAEAALRESGDADVTAAAAADAISKANQALADAKTYADGLNTAMDTRMGVVEAKAHEHSNKALLDTYTQTEANLADAVAKKHEHSNLTVLEGITAAKVSAWDASEGNAKTYADGLNTAMDTRVATLETWHSNFIEVSEEEINALFA